MITGTTLAPEAKAILHSAASSGEPAAAHDHTTNTTLDDMMRPAMASLHSSPGVSCWSVNASP